MILKGGFFSSNQGKLRYCPLFNNSRGPTNACHSLGLKRALSVHSSPRAITTAISAQHRTHLIFGANTDVGKTLVTTGLVRAGLLAPNTNKTLIHYIKPLQSGGSGDQAFVQEHCPSIDKQQQQGTLKLSTLFSWDTPASPHFAALQENKPVSDGQVIAALRQAVQEGSDAATSSTTTWIETAGGVLSPSAASPHNNRHGYHAQTKTNNKSSTWGWTLQGDLYRAFQGMIAPVVLVGDGRLGGISCTLSALESLLHRGYDVAAIVMINTTHDDDNNSNAQALSDYVRGRCLRSTAGDPVLMSPSSIVSLPAIPDDSYVPLHDWFHETTDLFLQLNQFLASQWQGQVSDLRQLAQQGNKESSVLWLDESTPILNSQFQDKTSVLMPDSPLRLVEWTGDKSSCVPASAVHLAQALVSSSSNDRVLYTASASQAVEAAIRMGIRTYQQRMGVSSDGTTEEDTMMPMHWILATQEDGMHGDTLGALNAAEHYIERDHPWYESKGFCLPPARMGYQNGLLTITPPPGGTLQEGDSPTITFDSMSQALDTSMRSLTKLFSLYKEMIEMQWLVKEHSSGKKIASVLIEPILQFDTMGWVDPLWQRAMMEVAESRSIPVILDETRVGLYRLGHCSLRSILKKEPDISVHAMGNMGATVASKAVYEACTGSTEEDSLFFGCQTDARQSVDVLHHVSQMQELYQMQPSPRAKLCLDEQSLKALSEHEIVRDAFSLGSICSVAFDETTDDDDVCSKLVQTMRVEKGIFLQQTGNVVYLDCLSPTNSESGEHQDLVRTLSDCIRELY